MTRRAMILMAALMLACSGSGRQKVADDLADQDSRGTADVQTTDTAPPQDLQEQDVVVPSDTDSPQDAVEQDVVVPADTTPPQDVAPTDTFELPEGCCFTADDCDGDLVCVGTEGGPWPDAGSCQPSPAEGQCWSDEDCESPVDWCEGAVVCGCGEKCMLTPGWCLHVIDPPSCCTTDADCVPGFVCSPTIDPGGPGVCKEQPPAGLCWLEAHCLPGQSCEGANICPCDALCGVADQPGTCTIPCDDNDCCCAETDCDPGWSCVSLDAGNVCLPTQPEGMCWQHSDCGPNGFCQGAIPCPCGWDCDGDGWDIPGSCIPTGGDMCCKTDADCPQLYLGQPMFCFIQDGNPFVVGTCQPMAPPGKCWSDEDCFMIQTCQGEGFCPCGMDCQAPGTAMGDCTPLPGGCCYTDADCGEGHVCRGIFPGDNMPGSCVPDPNGPECLGDAQCCWNDADCGYGTCQGASVCGCIELCPVCGACMPDQMGFCGG